MRAGVYRTRPVGTLSAISINFTKGYKRIVCRTHALSLPVGTHPNVYTMHSAQSMGVNAQGATSDNFVACACVRQIGMASYSLEYGIIFIGI